MCGRFTFERSTDTQTLIDVVNGAKVRERERERNVCVEETEEDERKRERERALLLPDMLAEEIL